MNATKLKELNIVFNELKRSSVNGVRGVWVLDSGRPGPKIGITILTHGNEPSGLAVYRYFRHVFPLRHNLKKGSVYFVINNLGAAEQYLTSTKRTRETSRPSQGRFIDINMNRLPENVFCLRNDQRSEIRRAQSLRNIWNLFDYALDIHSTSQPKSPQMILPLGRSDLSMISRFPIQTVVSAIDTVQSGKPASYFYGNRKAMVYAIEAGQHENQRSLKCAITCTEVFLAALDVISGNVPTPKRHKIEFRIFDTIWFPNESYKLCRIFPNFTKLHKGEILAKGNDRPITAPKNCYAIMAPKTKKPTNLKEEVLFLATKESLR